MQQRRHGEADAEAEGEQVVQRDRPLGGDRVVERAVRGAQHAAVRQFGQPALDRVVQPDPPLLDQEHRSGGGDRLGHRGDAEDGVAPHGRAGAQVLLARDCDVDRVAARHQSDRARQRPVAHVILEQGNNGLQGFLPPVDLIGCRTTLITTYLGRMSTRVPYATTLLVRDTCLCLHTQRTARRLARRFDEAMRPFGLTSGQFSLLNALNRPTPPSMGPVAELLVMDRTTLTAALKPLQRRGWVAVAPDPADRRIRLLTLTPAGHMVLLRALPSWHRVEAELEALLPGGDAAALRRALDALV